MNNCAVQRIAAIKARSKDKIVVPQHWKNTHNKLYAARNNRFTAAGLTQKGMDDRICSARDASVSLLHSLGVVEPWYICQRFHPPQPMTEFRVQNTKLITYLTPTRGPVGPAIRRFVPFNLGRAVPPPPPPPLLLPNLDEYFDDDGDMENALAENDHARQPHDPNDPDAIENVIDLEEVDGVVLRVGQVPANDPKYVLVPEPGPNNTVRHVRRHKSLVLSHLSSIYGHLKSSKERLARVREV